MSHLPQQPTVVLLNSALVACIALLVFLLYTSLVHNPPLVPHFAVLLVFAVGLLASVNWCADGKAPSLRGSIICYHCENVEKLQCC